jgi:hypothetical protein
MTAWFMMQGILARFATHLTRSSRLAAFKLAGVALSPGTWPGGVSL